MSPIRGYLLSIENIEVQSIEPLLKRLKENYNTIVFDISHLDDQLDMGKIKKKIDSEGFDIYYWIEVGRDPMAASKHPEWLHRPHKLHFYGNEPVVIYPWVSVNNSEVFEYEWIKVK